jgi:ribosome-associated protein
MSASMDPPAPTPPPDDRPTPPRGSLHIAPGVWVRPDAVQVTFSRSSGPGGQSVNKLNTRAVLRVEVAGIIGLDDTAATRLRRMAGSRLTQDDAILIQSDVSRSQRQNRLDCEERLRELVRRALRPPRKRTPTTPTRAARERRLKAKRELSEKKRRRAGGDGDRKD